MALERAAASTKAEPAGIRSARGSARPSVLYVGDHISATSCAPRKNRAGAPAMIIQELDAEIEAHEACQSDSRAAPSTRAAIVRGRAALLSTAVQELPRTPDITARRIRRSVASSAPGTAAAASTRDRSRKQRARSTDRSQLSSYWGSLLKEHDDEHVRPAGRNLLRHLYATGLVPTGRTPATVLPFTPRSDAPRAVGSSVTVNVNVNVK